jgi:nucleoside-diphosphate-sugar epimerase
VTAYGRVKILGERMVESYHREFGLPTVNLRIGWAMHATQILGLFTARNAIATLKARQHPLSNLFIEGIGEPWKAIEDVVDDPDTLLIPRNLQGQPWVHHPTHMLDTVQGILLAMERTEAVGEAFNIFAAQPTTWAQGARYVQQRTARPLVEVTLPNYWAFHCDIAKARSLLGFRPEHDYRRMIDDALAVADGQDAGVIV